VSSYFVLHLGISTSQMRKLLGVNYGAFPKHLKIMARFLW
jgi:hypothetical protein